MQEASIEIGGFDPAEADQLGLVFFDAVRTGAAEFYDVDQRAAWAPMAPSGPTWAARLSAQRTVVARDRGRPIGFMTLASDGCVDLAFVAPAYQRQGVGGLMYERIEAFAQEARMERLYSEASFLVRRLFQQRGWTVLREQRVSCAGVTLTNFAMEKRLAATPRG